MISAAIASSGEGIKPQKDFPRILDALEFGVPWKKSVTIRSTVSKLMWQFRVDAKIGRETFRSTKGEELGKTQVKPTVSASILLPKNWKTQLKEDLVLPDLGERISKRYPRNGGFELSKTPHNLE